VTTEFVAGNSFVPGVTSADQISDPTNPCKGAVPRRHAHFFTKSGAFGSLDWRGRRVDDGMYRVIDGEPSLSPRSSRKSRSTTRSTDRTSRLLRSFPEAVRVFAARGRSRWPIPERRGSACVEPATDPETRRATPALRLGTDGCSTGALARCEYRKVQEVRRSSWRCCFVTAQGSRFVQDRPETSPQGKPWNITPVEPSGACAAGQQRVSELSESMGKSGN